jgi:hypothetical protein
LEQTHEACKFMMKTPKGLNSIYLDPNQGEGKGPKGLGQPFCYSKEWLEKLNNTFGEEPSRDA